MSSKSKREGAVGIAYQADPGTAATAAVFDVICDDCNIPGDPIKYERVNNINAEHLGSQNGGLDVKFNMDGIEPNAALMGYLIWLFGGGYTRPTTIHQLSQVFDSKYLTMFKDQGDGFGSSDEQVQIGVGGRIDSLTIDQQVKAFAKVGISGMMCDKDVDGTPLAPSVSLVAADAPLSWAALQAGDFKLGYDSLTTVTDDNITGLKLTMTRALSYGGVKLGGNQPDSIVQGARAIMLEYTRDFEGDTAAKAEYANYIAGTGFISVSMKWLMDTSYVDITIPHLEITGDPMPSVGTGEEAQVVTVTGKAFLNASSNIMDVLTNDGNETVDFDALT